MSADDLGELARILQTHTPLCQLSDMQVRAALELMQQRGWKITRAKAMPEPVRYSDTTTIREEPEVVALISRAAWAKGSKISERLRQAHRAALRADGFDPATIPARDAGGCTLPGGQAALCLG